MAIFAQDGDNSPPAGGNRFGDFVAYVFAVELDIKCHFLVLKGAGPSPPGPRLKGGRANADPSWSGSGVSEVVEEEGGDRRARTGKDQGSG